ncbi:LysR family transcriptional regulator [Pseudomonas citronellolis]|jgi:DNA-binding transcriptional LysR family regulator|uniref:LysR family transcriptional regulator n=1 Tax=Pseudomonas citronellolis TaxID=53408 RepID=A0AAW6PFV2_9PSED|nr:MULTISPECIES: LysR family transcriptional regulator [Pseudomonas]AMO75201.1 HTH-type transcriptional regulator BenM [Pseudomonas citronellolis]KRV81775.1 transcriptional regulator [Pseudomonas citronellolis]KRW77209.1 transcriptional regulator [Pseudomonas citronellolis]KWR77570.1 transcriptional regulator [Pseudomonas sp. PI1]MBB1606639.1 transcriptional regulator [Pseudomonas sp. UMC76]
MDLRQLRYFIALTEHRSFVRAADAMGITQPAFSRSIQGLEQELGCQLVDRGSKELRPTPEGQVVLQHALRLVQGAANLTQEITQLNKLDAGELHFGCGPAPAQKLVPDAVARLIRRHPRLQIDFQVDNWERLSRSLLRDEIEFFIADIRHFEADPGFQTRPLSPRRGFFFCRTGHPLLAKESLSTNDLFAYPLASARMPPGIRKLLANLSGKSDLQANIQCEHLGSLVRIVSQTDAIGVGSEDGLRHALANGEVARLHLRNLPHNIDSLQARCGIVSRTGYRLSAAARALIEMLVELDEEERSAVA